MPNPFCRCGCSKKVSKLGNKYIFGHAPKPGRNKLPRETRICKCGCGQVFECKANGSKQYINGHNRKGKQHSEKSKRKNSDAHKGITKEINSNLAHSEETKRKMSERMKGNVLSDEIKRRISETKKAQKRPPLGQASITGWKHSLKAIKKIGDAARGRKTSVEVRTKQSKSKIQAILNGTFHPERHGKAGWYFSRKNKKSFYYRSKLEKNWFMLLDKLSKVKGYEVESVFIGYFWKGMVHRYIPDLLIEYQDSSFELIEIKPESLWNLPINKAKWRAAKKWCKKQQKTITFQVVGYKERMAV